ncbi:MAG: hypothetical protein HYZ42_18105 [Bacteroidetes bacterium]|nr:hypothetical protein [Bacteroidota bacterium]
MCDGDFKKNPHSFTNQNGFDWRQHRAIAGFSLGVSAEKMVSKNWYIKSGLQSYIGGYDIKNEFTTYQAPLNASAKADQQLEVVKSRYRMAYIETPLLVGIKKSLSDIDLKVDGGLTLSARMFEVIPDNAGLLGKEYAVWNGNSKLLNASVQITPSVSYKLGKWNMNTGIEWRYQLTSTYKTTYPVKEHLYYLGLKTGINL